MKSKSQHWDNIFSAKQDANLGWYETDLSPTFSLLDNITDWEAATIFIAGVGTSHLVDVLLEKNINLVVNDISATALDSLKNRVGKSANNMTCLCQDISQPITESIPKIDIWLDRAVLHFLQTEENIKAYFNNLNSQLKIGGYVLLAEFSKQGAKNCADLPVHQYDIDEYSSRLGSAYQLISHFDHACINPRGEPRPYIYALFKRLE